MENRDMDGMILEHTNATTKANQPVINLYDPSQLRAMINELYSGNFEFPKNFGFYNWLCSQHPDVETINIAFYTAYHKTIEQYRLEYRLNKIKEFLVYTDIPIHEIAARLGFEHTSHLLCTLEQQTGLSASFFKQVQKQKRHLINSIPAGRRLTKS